MSELLSLEVAVPAVLAFCCLTLLFWVLSHAAASQGCADEEIQVELSASFHVLTHSGCAPGHPDSAVKAAPCVSREGMLPLKCVLGAAGRLPTHLQGSESFRLVWSPPEPLAERSLSHPCHHNSLLAHTPATPVLPALFLAGLKRQRCLQQAVWNKMVLQAGAAKVRNTARLGGWQGALKHFPLCQSAVPNANERGWAPAARGDGCCEPLNTSSVKCKQNIQGFERLEAPFASLH